MNSTVPPPSLFERLDRALEMTIYYLSAALMIALTVIIFYAVFMRYVFNLAPSWSEEVPRVIFLWVSFLAIAVAVKRGHNLRVMFIIEKFPPRLRLAIELIMHVAIFVMLAYLIWHNQPVIDLNRGSKMLASGWSDAVRFWPLTVGCVLMALYQFRQVARSLDDYRTGRAR